MEIVIKISERAYEFVKKNGLKDVFGIDSAICNGVVLPKGHGRLIDADALLKDFKASQAMSFAEYVKASNILHHAYTKRCLVEADKEETTNETNS